MLAGPRGTIKRRKGSGRGHPHARPDEPPVNLSLHNYTTFANLLAWPLTPITGLVAAFNIVLLVNVALSGWAAFLLARELTGRTAESWIAGALFALSPVLVARSVGHFSLVAAAPLPIFLLLLRRASHTRALRHAIGLGAVIAWAACCDAYYGVFCLAMGGMMLLAQLVRVHRSTESFAPRTLIARRAATAGRSTRSA
ncbi:MAG TPA: hypothetical protein VIL35_10795 [Vicinamibacterales bacterium]